MLFPASIFPASFTTFIIPAATVVDAHSNKLRVYTTRMRQLELQPRVVEFEKVSRVIHRVELDKADSTSSLISSQPDSLDVVHIKDFQIRRHARKAVKDIILRRVVRKPFDNNGS